MKEVEPESKVCFNRYSKAMSEIQAKTEEKQTLSEVDEISYQKKKRDAANEGIRSVCW